jgi:hypothetical protein
VSGSLLALDLVEPAFCTSPESFTTLGPEVADLATEIGFAPDPEQRMLLDMMYGMRRDRTPTAFEFCVVCSRQNLKTGLFKMAAIADAFYFHEPLTIWTAHRFDTTEGAFRDIKKLIDSSDLLTRRVRKITEGNGDEEITLLDGCLIQFKARGASGGRGKTGGKMFLDEGFALQQPHIGSLYPIMATIPGAQVRIGSSAGLAASEVLRDIRDRGRKGDVGLAYAEWSDIEPPSCLRMDCDHHRDAPGCCLDDRRRWVRSNPAMGRRISEERIATFRRSMPPAEFAREFLGWWDESTAESVFDIAAWKRLLDPDSKIAGNVSLGVQIAQDRTWACIGAAGVRSDGLMHTQVVENHRGTAWLIDKIVQHTGERGGEISLSPNSQAGSLIDELEARGVSVRKVPTIEYAQACGNFFDLYLNSGLRHIGQDELDVAVEGARKRVAGDAWMYDRKFPDLDISPLDACVLAVDAASVDQPSVYEERGVRFL